MMLFFLNNVEGAKLLFVVGYLLIIFLVSVVLPCWLIIEIIKWLRRH